MSAPSINKINLSEASRLCGWLVECNGYLAAKVLPDGSVAALQDLLFTRAIALGCHREGWSARFCFKDITLADQQFAKLLSEDDVPHGHVATRQGLRQRGSAPG